MKSRFPEETVKKAHPNSSPLFCQIERMFTLKEHFGHFARPQAAGERLPHTPNMATDQGFPPILHQQQHADEKAASTGHHKAPK
jgi:hypothetical protein